MPDYDVLTWMKAVLNTTPSRWHMMAQVLPAELLTQPPAPGEWSALECLEHIVDTEEKVFQVRLKCFLAGQDFPAFNPDSEGTQGKGSSPEEVVARFAHLRSESLQALDSITPADLSRRARHQELGMVSLEEMLNEWAAHDLNHTVQAERALMQPFIRGCGPWQVYFTDHVVK